MSAIVVGVISDTHGLVRPEALRALAGTAAIIHAGDVGNPRVLEELGLVAPVHAVRGNVDREHPLRALPGMITLELGGHLVHVLHDLAALDLEPEAAGISVVVSGHSHVPRILRKGGVLYLNPGSAGPRRFKLPVSLARLELDPAAARAELVPIAG